MIGNAQFNPYPSPLDQAWLRFWVGLYGPDSRLARYILPGEPANEYRTVPQIERGVAAPDQNAKQHGRDTRPPKVEKIARERSATREEKRRNKKIDADNRRMEPLSDWAKRLIGDERINDITLDSVIDGIEDYFVTFERLRKVDLHAYRYFSRIGVPLWLRNLAAERSRFYGRIPNGGVSLPSFFGAFIPRTGAEYRDEIINDKPSFGEFIYFSKVKNPATVAPLGATIFAQNEIRLGRDVFSKEELKRFPAGSANFGIWWYAGVLPDGTVRALPCRMEHYQKLPRGGGVHTSRFQIPPGLSESGRDPETGGPLDAHTYVQINFAAVLAFTAAAVSGIHVTIRKGKRSARIGLPIAAVREFFADRDLADGRQRRKPILHLRLSHDRYLHDGRVVTVGEHLAGERQFSWRGYDISIGVPGIHFPSPEGLNIELWEDGPDNAVPPNLGKLQTIDRLGGAMSNLMWRQQRVRFQRGVPERTYAPPTLDEN